MGGMRFAGVSTDEKSPRGLIRGVLLTGLYEKKELVCAFLTCDGSS